MQYRLVVSYWNENDELCGCDVIAPVPFITPEMVEQFPLLAPAQTVHALASLDNLADAALLWVAGYDMVENGENQ